MGVRPGGRARRGGGGGPAGRRSGCTYWEELNPRGSSPEVGEEGEGEGMAGRADFHTGRPCGRRCQSWG